MTTRSGQRGFTLLELVMVIVIVALASVPILGQFSQAASAQLVDESIQTAAQLAQERAESVLALRRASGYAAIATGTTTDTLNGTYSGYIRTLTVNSPATGNGCASGASCKEVIVNVASGGRTRATVSFMLVDY
jgi:prepilin-type N-terminal cleavage/methylation domain-containing protein